MKLSIKKVLSLAVACALTLTSVGAVDMASAAKRKKAAAVPTENLTIQASADKAVTGSAVVKGVKLPATKAALRCYYNASFADSISTASAVATTGNAVTVTVTAAKNAKEVSGAAVDVLSNNTTVASIMVSIKAAEKKIVKKTKSVSIKSKVVIPAGKSKNVKYVLKKTAAADKAYAVKFATSNKKVVKASKVAGKKQVKLTVPKKAVKGSSAKVTLTSGKKKAAIKVLVQNKTKKVKAAKRYISVKKGRKIKVTVNVTAQNKKKATTDTISAKAANSKLVKVAKTAAKKGKVVLTVKGKKAGTSKLDVKVGSKKVTLTVNVR